MPMNVILLERVPKLGQMGDVVKVKPGFARNFLLPQKKALRATKDNITYFESQRKVLEAQNLERSVLLTALSRLGRGLHETAISGKRRSSRRGNCRQQQARSADQHSELASVQDGPTTSDQISG